MRRGLRCLVALAAAFVALGPLNAATGDASGPPGGFRIRLWMLPPVDALGNKACLTQGWHGTMDSRVSYNRALDWKAGNTADTSCTFSGSELVRFRAKAASIDEAPDGTSWAALYGVQSNLPPEACGNGTDHIGKVKIYGYDGVLKGFMMYAHTSLYSGQFDIQARTGSSQSGAYLTSIGIGNTVQDGPADCWSGWHVHNVNSKDAVMYWDNWNSKWGTASTCNCYTNNSDSNWIVQMTAPESIGE